MRIATWNVNSIRARQDRVVAWLERSDCDVLAIQETKCKNEQFPLEPFEQAGYQVAHHGISQWNGVAILSRVGLEDVEINFPHQPGFTKDPEKEPVVEARALAATCAGIRIWSLYVPNGRELTDPHYDYKISWLKALQHYSENWIQENPSGALALVGDWNVVPTDGDVWDMAAFDGKTHVSAPERDAFHSFLAHGFTDVSRTFIPGPHVYTYWDYTKLRFPKGEGMRIDFPLLSDAAAQTVTGVQIDREERKGKGASDHCPVIVDLDI